MRGFLVRQHTPSPAPPPVNPPTGARSSHKVSRVVQLERARDALTARVDEANAREKGVGERLAALEETMAEAKMDATKTGSVGCQGRAGYSCKSRLLRHTPTLEAQTLVAPILS